MAKSAIEWTQSTWNPVTGCSKVSPGCKHCYAERMAKRLQAMGQPNYSKGFRVALHPEMLEHPLSWKKPQTIFVNSMSDLFHEDVSQDFLARVFDVMARASWHTFQVLTKRAERLEEVAPTLQWPRNVWMGVSVESPNYLHRLNHLRNVPAAVRFVSFEPLLEALGVIDLKGVDWAIVGGESGPGARPIERAWVVDIRTQCRAARVPFFFKQWGGTNKKLAGRLLDERTWDDLPRVVASAEDPLRADPRGRVVDPTSCTPPPTSSDPRPMTR
jgi:protein gp37